MLLLHTAKNAHFTSPLSRSYAGIWGGTPRPSVMRFPMPTNRPENASWNFADGELRNICFGHNIFVQLKNIKTWLKYMTN